MDEYLTPQEWRARALRAEAQAAAAMDCLRKLAAGPMPQPWRDVVQCAYVGCGGELEQVTVKAPLE
jgi:hypothetical protein